MQESHKVQHFTLSNNKKKIVFELIAGIMPLRNYKGFH